MIVLTSVVGLELFAVSGKYGIYVRCDHCGDTLDADRINTGSDNERIGCDETCLRAKARTLGWTGDLSRSSSNDLCPTCNILKG